MRAAKRTRKLPLAGDEWVLFGAGSPLLVDFEETCRRAGRTIVAIVRNVEGPCSALDARKVVDLAAVSRALFQRAVAIPLFTPSNRSAAFQQASALGATRFEPLVDSSAVLPSSLTIERGVYVNAGVIIGAASTLFEFSLVNRGSVLGHHFRLGSFASVGPGVVAGGQVTIGSGAILGAGCVILPRITIGERAVVGAGSVVTRNVAADTTVVGNPARVVTRAMTTSAGSAISSS